jgi:Asp-tRNA(Asn)/Glu-tRNA(Gln) amidotransferase A subunit family amidase
VRRASLTAAVTTACLCLLAASPAGQRPVFDVMEKTIPELAAAMTAGAVSSRDLVAAHLARVEAYDHRGPINAIITINPRALADAEALETIEALEGGPST